MDEAELPPPPIAEPPSPFMNNMDLRARWPPSLHPHLSLLVGFEIENTMFNPQTEKQNEQGLVEKPPPWFSGSFFKLNVTDFLFPRNECEH